TVGSGSSVVETNWRPHLSIVGAAQQFLRFQRIVPSRQIFDGEIQAAVRSRVHTRRNPLLILENLILENIASSAIRDDVSFANHTSVLHTQRVENAFLQKIAPELAAHFANENAQRYIPQIAVAPLFPRSEAKRLCCNHLKQIVFSVISLERKNFRIVAEPGCLR